MAQMPVVSQAINSRKEKPLAEGCSEALKPDTVDLYSSKCPKAPHLCNEYNGFYSNTAIIKK